MKLFIKKNARLLGLITITLIVLAAIAITRVVANKQPSYQTVQACQRLTAVQARAVLSSTGEQSTRDPLRTNATVTTFCTYRTTTKLASLAIRSPRNAQGLALNKEAFNNPPLNSERVTGLGDAAYWTPSLGQLNMLRNQQWYIVSAGSLQVRERSVEEAKKLAEAILK